MLPLDETTVTQVSVLPDDEIEGEAMRVYQITVDPAAVLESDAAGLLNMGVSGGFGSLPGGGGLPGNMDGSFLPPGTPPAPAADELTPPAPEDIQMTFAVYIGAADGLVHRIYSIVAVAARNADDGTTSTITVTSIINYSKFNEPVEITAPEIAS